MTTVIWNNGELIADSRISFPTVAGKWKPSDDSFMKIREVKNFLYKGAPIHAFSASGDARVFSFYDYLADFIAKNGQTIEITETELYVGLREHKVHCNMMFITDEHVVVVSCNEFGTISLTEYPATERVSMGSGIEKNMKIAMCPALDAVDIMAYVKKVDKRTGGPVARWTKEGGIVNDIALPSLWTVIKKIFKNDFQFYAQQVRAAKAA